MKRLLLHGALHRLLWIAALLVLAIALGRGAIGTALAQPTGLRDSAIAKACGVDVRKHCRGVEPGGGRVVACLQSHEAELSVACKAQLPQAAQCQQQVLKLCGDGTREQQRACVESKRGELASACGALTAAK